PSFPTRRSSDLAQPGARAGGQRGGQVAEPRLQRPHVGMADGAGQRVGRVGRRGAIQRQQALYHHLHLLLGRAAGAHDGFLDLQRGVFMHGQLAVGQRAQGGAARLPEQQGGGGVGVEEDDLQRGHIGAGIARDLAEIVQDDLQALRQRQRRRHHDGAAGDVAQAHAFGIDHTEAGAAQAGIDAEDAHQWRKWRVPVSTMAMPCSSAAAMTSSSRTLPPGWITPVAPAATTTSRPSRNGKKASEATAEPFRVRPAFSALMDAMRAESMRLIWPAPTPRVMPPPTNTMALDLTYLATFQAKVRSFISASVGWRRVTARSASRGTLYESGVCTSQPPPTRLMAQTLCPAPAGTSSTRTFFLAASTASAAPS